MDEREIVRVRGRLVVLSGELNGVLSDARLALLEVEGGVWFAEDELSGVPASTLTSMKVEPTQNTSSGSEIGEGEVYFCAFASNNHTVVMNQCKRAASRKKLYLAKQNRYRQNLERLGRILDLRDEIARLLG